MVILEIFFGKKIGTFFKRKKLLDTKIRLVGQAFLPKSIKKNSLEK